MSTLPCVHCTPDGMCTPCWPRCTQRATAAAYVRGLASGERAALCLLGTIATLAADVRDLLADPRCQPPEPERVALAERVVRHLHAIEESTATRRAAR